MERGGERWREVERGGERWREVERGALSVFLLLHSSSLLQHPPNLETNALRKLIGVLAYFPWCVAAKLPKKRAPLRNDQANQKGGCAPHLLWTSRAFPVGCFEGSG